MDPANLERLVGMNVMFSSQWPSGNDGRLHDLQIVNFGATGCCDLVHIIS